MKKKINKDIIINGMIWKQACTGCGYHDTFWSTVITSPQWKAWKEYAKPKMLYDFDENEELGIISNEHFQDFIKFIKKRNL